MSRLSAWPIRIVFRVLVIATVVALLAIALVVTYSYRSQKQDRAAYLQVVIAYTNVKDMQNTGTKIVLDNTINSYVPQVGDTYKDAVATDLKTMQGFVDSSSKLDVPNDFKQQISAAGAAYADLGNFLTGLAKPKTQAEGDQQTADYNAKVAAAAGASRPR